MSYSSGTCCIKFKRIMRQNTTSNVFFFISLFRPDDVVLLRIEWRSSLEFLAPSAVDRTLGRRVSPVLVGMAVSDGI